MNRLFSTPSPLPVPYIVRPKGRHDKKEENKEKEKTPKSEQKQHHGGWTLGRGHDSRMPSQSYHRPLFNSPELQHSIPSFTNHARANTRRGRLRNGNARKRERDPTYTVTDRSQKHVKDTRQSHHCTVRGRLRCNPFYGPATGRTTTHVQSSLYISYVSDNYGYF